MNAKYRLEAIFRLRKKAEQDAARLVGARKDELNRAEADSQRVQNELATCRACKLDARTRMHASALIGIKANLLLGHRLHVSDIEARENDLVQQATRAIGEVARAEAMLEQAISGFKEALAQTKMIEIHRRTWQSRVQVDTNRREQRRIDEVSAVIHGKGRRLDST